MKKWSILATGNKALLAGLVLFSISATAQQTTSLSDPEVASVAVTADEIKDPQNLDLSCRLNGEIRQSSNTADMIFSVAEIVSYLSKFMTLLPGDLILTGTPEGVIMGMKPQHWLHGGDMAVVEIEGLGSSENKFV
ncbi:MAG: hypothetical protein BGO52_02390 [Sphingobacteriales bacterium 44-61]|nr:MAG: hypothetical protein BGO52_02390 [Sphingobacteriales bacterium 44-61]